MNKKITLKNDDRNSIKDKSIKKKSKEKDSTLNDAEMDHILSSILAIIIFIIAIITLFGTISNILSYPVGGQFGEKLFTGMLNWFGVWSYIIFIPLFYVAYIIWGDKEISWNIKKLISTPIIILGISNIFAIIDHYNNSKRLSGEVFSYIGNIFIKLFGLIPLLILSICIIYIGYIILMNRRHIIDKESLQERIINIKEAWQIWANGIKRKNPTESVEEEPEYIEEDTVKSPTLHQEVFKELKKNEPAEIVEMEREILEA